MNYTKIYNDIIHKAQSRYLTSGYETHHIVPKCLDGPNNKSNLVRLTIKEHFVCHRLLIKMHQGIAKQKMSFAFYRLCNRHQIKNSRAYETAKFTVKKALSQIHKGKTLTAKHRLQIKNRTSGEQNPMYGKKHSNDALQIMRECKLNNTNARVGVKVLDADSNILLEFSSIKELMTYFNISRGQAENYIYNKRPFNGLIFERNKIITRK